jgi:hypothetical protein
MGILDNVHKIEKRIEKFAERSDIPLQPLEIRKAALDEIEDLVEPSGRARRVFPYNQVTVEVVVAQAGQRAAMEAVLGEQGGMASAVTERLRGAGCAAPRDLDVKLKLVRRPGAEWETGRVFRVVCGKKATAQAATSPGPASARPAAVAVIRGEATHKAYGLKTERTNIGRLDEVLDRDKRVVRRNQVVFTDRENGINQTVSRAHAHIVRTPDGSYRLFDDHSSCGTRVFRGGRTIALPSGSPRGTRLQTGDEIYVGQACLRFEIVKE